MRLRLAVRISAFVLAFAVALSAPATAQVDAELEKFSIWAAEEIRKDQMPALSVAVLDDGRLWGRGFGLADVENGVPASEKSSYRMASVTKPMTAVAALRLAEKGLLDLDAPIRSYLPWFPDKGAPITVRQLLGHLGGISHYRNYLVEGRIRDPKTTREAIAIFEDFELIAAPGEKHAYSSYGYNLAGAVLEAAAGKPYAELMRELVWDPAGMTDTRMDDPRAIIPHRVDGYTLQDGKLRKSDYVDISSRFAGGGTRATVIDMVRFAAAIDEGRLLEPESLDAMWTPQTTNAGRWTFYGLGWGVESMNGRFLVNHGGAQQETRTLLLLFPRENLAIALASNFENAQLSKYRDRLFWHLTGEAWDPATYASDPRDRLALHLARQIFDAGRLHYEKYGREATTDPGELRVAFAELRRLAAMVAENREDAFTAIGDALHPASSQPLLKAGSWIAARLASRDQSRYHRLGGLAFLEDYVALYRRDASIPRSYRLPRDFERRVLALSDAWEQVWTPEVAEMVVDGAPGAERFAASVEGKRAPRVLPNFSGDLVVAVESSFQRGDSERAARFAHLAAELHPEDSESTGVNGVLLSLSGDRNEGLAMLTKSASLNSRGYARAANLRSIARFVHGTGMTDAALGLLQNAAVVHPRDAETHVAIGAVYAGKGMPAEARRAYETALEIDPGMEGAREGLKKLTP
ncbi:MAG: serine hydrolase [Thermoanaerobaculia bacterium]